MLEYNSLNIDSGRIRSDASLDIQIKDAKKRAEEFSKFLKETNFEEGTNNSRKEHDITITNDYNQLIHHYNSTLSSDPSPLPQTQAPIQNNGIFRYDNHKSANNDNHLKSVIEIENHPNYYKSVELNQNDNKIQVHSNNNDELIIENQKLRNFVFILNKEKAQLQFEILSLNKLLKEAESRNLHQISQTQQQQESQQKIIQTLKNNYSTAIQETAKLKSDYNDMKHKLDTISSRNIFLEKLLESKHIISPAAAVGEEADADTTSSSSHSSDINTSYVSSLQLPSEYYNNSTSFFQRNKPSSSEDDSQDSEFMHPLLHITNNNKINSTKSIHDNKIPRNPQSIVVNEELKNIDSSKTTEKHHNSDLHHTINNNNNNIINPLTMRSSSPRRTITNTTSSTKKDSSQTYLGDIYPPPSAALSNTPNNNHNNNSNNSNNNNNNNILTINADNKVLQQGNFFDDSEDEHSYHLHDGNSNSNRNRDSGLAAWERRLIRKSNKSKAVSDSSDNYSDSEESVNGNKMEDTNSDYFHDSSKYVPNQDENRRIHNNHLRYPSPSTSGDATTATASNSMSHNSKRQPKDSSYHNSYTTTTDSYHHLQIPNLSMSSDQLRELLAEMRALQNLRDQGDKSKDAFHSTTTTNNNNNNNNNVGLSNRFWNDHEREGKRKGGREEELSGTNRYIKTAETTGMTSEYPGRLYSKLGDRHIRDDASTTRWNDMLLSTTASGESDSRERRGVVPVPYHHSKEKDQSPVRSQRRTETPKRHIQVCLPRSAIETTHSDKSYNSINMSPSTNLSTKPIKSINRTVAAAAVTHEVHNNNTPHPHGSRVKKSLNNNQNIKEQGKLRSNSRSLKTFDTKTDERKKGHYSSQYSLNPEKFYPKSKVSDATEMFRNRQTTKSNIKNDHNNVHKIANHNQTTKLRTASVSSAARDNAIVYSNSNTLLENSRGVSSTRRQRPISASSLSTGRDRATGLQQQAQQQHEQSRTYGLSRSKSTDAIANKKKKKR